ncbi:MAG: hypothetical protein WDA42_07590 [Candidatus Bathyarchaeia archaeon]
MNYHVKCLDIAICDALNDIAHQYKWHVKTKIDGVLSSNEDVKMHILIDYDTLIVHMNDRESLSTMEQPIATFIKELQKGPSQFICKINDYAFYANYTGLDVGCMHINMQQLQQIYKVLQQFGFKGEPDGT